MGTNDLNVAPIMIYICLALAFNFFDLGLNIRLFRSRLYKEKIEDPLKLN